MDQREFEVKVEIKIEPEQFIVDELEAGETEEQESGESLSMQRPDEPDETSFKCSECSTVFSTWLQLELHQQSTHAQKNFPCGSCGKSFKTQITLDVHVDFKHSSEHDVAKKYSCSECLASFKFKTNFDFHNRSQHRGSAVAEFIPRMPTANADAEGNFSCQFCGKVNKVNVSLENHLEVNHEPVDGSVRRSQREKCSRTFSMKRNFKSHKLSNDHPVSSAASRNTPRTFPCSFCDFVSKRYHSFLQHIDFKHPEDNEARNYDCSKCERSFYLKSNLSFHLKTQHLGTARDSKFSCKLCDRKFCHKWPLQAHLDSSHPPQEGDVRKYSCDFCLRSFKLKSSLVRHVRSHLPQIRRTKPIDGAKGFSCSLCNKSYFTMLGLNFHADFHHQQFNDVPKKHNCDQCSASFGYKINFERHLKLH